MNNNLKQKPHVYCDLCHKEIPMTPGVLKEEHITLQKEGKQPHEAVLTFLHCPHCGKRYPVIMDDAVTLPLVKRLQDIRAKQVKQVKRGFNPSAELAQKFQRLNWKLDFKRQKLADEYTGAFYQLEDGTKEQLDYCYHAQ